MSEPTLAAQFSACGCLLLPCALADVRFEAARSCGAGPFRAFALFFAAAPSGALVRFEAARSFEAGPFPAVGPFFEAAPSEALFFADPVFPPARAFCPPRAFDEVGLGDLAIGSVPLDEAEVGLELWA